MLQCNSSIQVGLVYIELSFMLDNCKGKQRPFKVVKGNTEVKPNNTTGHHTRIHQVVHVLLILIVFHFSSLLMRDQKLAETIEEVMYRLKQGI